MTPSRLILAAVFALALARPTPAQPGGGDRSAPLIVTLIPYLGDTNLQKELQLKPEQATKLLAHRQKLWDEAYTTASNELSPDTQHKATEAALKELLTPKQYKRAVQL